MAVGEDNDKTGLAILCGHGDLPRLLAEKCKADNRPYIVVEFQNVDLIWAADHPVVQAQFEKASGLIDLIHSSGCTSVTLAGSIQRPKLNPLNFDLKGMKLAASILGARKKGDDESLRVVAKMFEDSGLTVVSAHSVLGELIPPTGVLGKVQPIDMDRKDAKKAASIIDALGDIDVGQGAVVAQGICLAIETIQGTDRMLQFVKDTRAQYITDESSSKGVLFKAPKLRQDRRMDMPTIGMQTIVNAHKAGLSGVVIEAGGVMVIDLEAVIKQADSLGVFLWSRANN